MDSRKKTSSLWASPHASNMPPSASRGNRGRPVTLQARGADNPGSGAPMARPCQGMAEITCATLAVSFLP
jgi:hypothetical protein